MDFFVTMLCDSDKVKTSDQLAASWGYYNTVQAQWNEDIMQNSGFPTEMLPEVLSPDHDAGCLAHDWFDIPAGTPIG